MTKASWRNPTGVHPFAQLGGAVAMSSEHWSFHDAKNRFGAIVEAARRGQPQIVSRRGVPAAVVLSIEDYERFASERSPTPPTFTDVLLSLPQDDGDFEPFDAGLRDWE